MRGRRRSACVDETRPAKHCKRSNSSADNYFLIAVASCGRKRPIPAPRTKDPRRILAMAPERKGSYPITVESGCRFYGAAKKSRYSRLSCEKCAFSIDSPQLVVIFFHFTRTLAWIDLKRHRMMPIAAQRCQ